MAPVRVRPHVSQAIAVLLFAICFLIGDGGNRAIPEAFQAAVSWK